MKKFDFKNINWKDPKLIFPLVLFFPVLFLGWMIFGIIEDMSSTEDNLEGSSNKQEIAGVPLGDSISIARKSDALLEAFKEEQDFTAIQLANELTRLDADTTLYSRAEQALIAKQEEEQALFERQIQEANLQIQERNSQLAENRRGLTGDPSTGITQQSSLDREIMMYQKLLRGEEILTPEQEEERKINKARLEERAKVLSEIQNKETLSVEKVSNVSSNGVFNTINKEDEGSSYIRAMVDQGVTVGVGSRIRFRLLDNIKIQETTIPSGSQVYATVTQFGDQRVMATINSIITKGKRVKVKLSVYDRDGIEGFFVPKSNFREFSKEAGSQALGQNAINFTSSPETLEGVALQTLQGVYQSASSAISNKMRENKAKIKYNTTIYLINDNE